MGATVSCINTFASEIQNIFNTEKEIDNCAFFNGFLFQCKIDLADQSKRRNEHGYLIYSLKSIMTERKYTLLAKISLLESEKSTSEIIWKIKILKGLKFYNMIYEKCINLKKENYFVSEKLLYDETMKFYLICENALKFAINKKLLQE